MGHCTTFARLWEPIFGTPAHLGLTFEFSTNNKTPTYSYHTIGYLHGTIATPAACDPSTFQSNDK